MEQLKQLSNESRIIFLILWSLVWKGYALWRAAKNDQKYWYVVLLLINFFGILEIAYLFFFQKEGRLWLTLFKKEKEKPPVKRIKK